MVALTAVLQAGARLATFFCRHSSASLPPGVTPEHFDMKSDRQLARMALCCSAVTCANAPVAGASAQATAASPMKLVRRMMVSPESTPLRPSIAAARLRRQMDIFGCKLLPRTAEGAHFGVSCP